MLSSVRTFANSWAARILFVVLVGCFALWGVADIALPRFNQSYVIEVGNRKISLPDFLHALFNVKQEISREKDPKLLENPQFKMMLAEEVVGDLVRKTLIESLIHRLDLHVGPTALGVALQKAFPNQDLNSDAFRKFLKDHHIQESMITHELSEQLKREIIVGTLLRSAHMPASMEETLAEQLTQERIIETTTIPAAVMLVTETPSENELKEFYEKHPMIFTVPESRNVALLTFRADQLPGEDKAQAAFDLSVELQDALAGGQTLKELSDQKEGTYTEFLEVREGSRPEGLPEAAFSALFDLGEGGESDLIPLNDDTYGMISVAKITPSKTKTFEEGHADALNAVQNIRRFERAEALARKLAATPDWKEKAMEKGFSVETITGVSLVDPKGLSEQGLESVLGLKVGESTSLLTPKGAQIFKVVQIAPLSPVDLETHPELKQTFDNEYSQDIFQSLLMALEEEFPVKIDSKALSNALSLEERD